MMHSESSRASSEIEAYLSEHELLCRGEGNVVRLPLLVRGELIEPPEFDAGELQRILGDRTYAEIDGAQVVSQDVLTPDTLRPAGTKLLLVMPRIQDPRRLLIEDTNALAHELYGLPFERVLEFVECLQHAFRPPSPLLERASALSQLTADAPRAFLDVALSHLSDAFDGPRWRAQIDFELAHGGLSGTDLLDGWVELPSPVTTGLSSALSAAFDGAVPAPGPRRLRALPTRQLHITAGNSPMLPLISCIRALALKSAAIVKLPAGALIAGSALAVALRFVMPDHPLARFTSVAYWRGGDERIENALFASGALDRIVVWGAPEAVQSVVQRAGFTKTVTFNPRYAVSIVCREALASDRAEVLRRVARDVMVWNQKACISSLVIYVEGEAAEAQRFTEDLSAQLARWDGAFPNPLPREALGRLRRARRGALMPGQWRSNGDPTAPSSAAVYMDAPFDLAEHPMTRVAVVRSVARAEDAIHRLSHAVSQVGIAGEARRHELRDAILARGVSCVLPLGEADSIVTGAPHDGLRSLSELVSWVVS